MKFALTALAVALSLGAGQSVAENTRSTASSDKDRATMEQKASPANPVKQDEERTAAHSQPDVPNASGGASKTPAKKPAKKKSKAGKSDKTSSSAGASRPASAGASQSPPPLSAEKEQAFKALDIDGDGDISKAEAAGHAEVVTGFDRADRNHDGKLSRAEYLNLGKKTKKQQASR